MRGLVIRLAVMDQAAIEERNSSQSVARWYAQAASLVAFLYERWGVESLGQIVERVRTGKRFDVALKEHTGLTMDEFELAWRKWLGATVIPPTLIPSPTFPPFPPTPTYEPTPIKR